MTRRQFLGAAGTAVAAAAVGRPARLLAAAPRVAIVGGGLAGLACADRLQAKGIQAVVYEAGSRLGGRCFSNRDLVPGMACENGGELIDTGHKTMLRYANEFDLRLESYVKKRGEERFWFQGRGWSDEDVVDEFREVVAAMQDDLHAISGSATVASHNAADVALDHTDLATYFATRTTGHPLIEAVLNETYVAEFGLETSQQSALNFLGFMRLNKQSKFEPFGVSDERFHLIDGNDGIVRGLEQKLRGPIVKGARLTRLARAASGEYRLHFNDSPQADTADASVVSAGRHWNSGSCRRRSARSSTASTWCCRAPRRGPRRAVPATEHISNTGRRTRCRWARTPATRRGSSPAWPASRANPPA